MTWALPTVSGMTPQFGGVASLSSKQLLAGARLLAHHSTAARPAAQRCLSVRAMSSRGYSDNGYGHSQGFHSSAAYRQVSTSASASVSCCFGHPLFVHSPSIKWRIGCNSQHLVAEPSCYLVLQHLFHSLTCCCLLSTLHTDTAV